MTGPGGGGSDGGGTGPGRRPGGVRTTAAILADIEAHGGDVYDTAKPWHNATWLGAKLGNPQRLLTRRNITDRTGICLETLRSWERAGRLRPVNPLVRRDKEYRAADVLAAAMAAAGER